jgi:hypothetical protein
MHNIDKMNNFPAGAKHKFAIGKKPHFLENLPKILESISDG